MITEHHETRFLLLAPHHQNIVDGDVRGEHLHLLDNTCPGLTLLVNKRGDLYDSTSCGPDKQDISGDSIDQRHGRINRDGGELLMRTGPDEVRLLGGGINSLVHQRVFLDKVEIFVKAETVDEDDVLDKADTLDNVVFIFCCTVDDS